MTKTITKKAVVMSAVAAVSTLATTGLLTNGAFAAYAYGTPTCPTASACYANGTPVTIIDDGGVTKMTWALPIPGELSVTEDHVIYGGFLNDATVTDTSITMTGGKVYGLVGGGRNTFSSGFKSLVGKAVIDVQGGEINYAAGGGYLVGGTLLDSKAKGTAFNIVEDASITIGAGAIAWDSATGVFGGGASGFTRTEKTTVTIEGGDWDFVIAGGSNGYTGDGTVNILGGNIGVVHGLNRGHVDGATLNVTGGHVANLHATGDPDPVNGSFTVDGEVGTIGTSTVSVSGTAVVDEISIGAVKAAAGATTDPVDTDTVELAYLPGTITNLAGLADFGPANITLLSNPTVPDPVTNPDTSDNVLLYALAAGLGLATVGVAYLAFRKKLA